MERLTLLSNSKEDIKLIADLARKIGITIEYNTSSDESSVVTEPENRAEWDKLSINQQQGLLDAIEDVKTNGGKPHEDVMKNFNDKIITDTWKR